jgi:gamma-glutamyltranspeptidase/glutathione hydrolase
MRQGGGLITTQDLADYRPVERKPLRGTYRGYELLASPPSSSGGTTLLEALNILETFQLTPDRNAPANVHRLAESLRRAYCDRARWLGDPAFTTIPEHLLTKEHGRELAASITERATPSRELAGEIRLAPETEHTTHFSVVDRERSAVSLTYTLENSYGSKVVVRGAGFLLNNEMNDFNPQPGVTDAKGRIGTDANLVRPGARPLSSMCPVVVLKGGQPVLVTGSPGGRTIISTVFCVVTDAIDFGLDVRSAVDAPRLYQPWFPDVLSLEKRWLKSAADLADELRGLGHTVKLIGEQGDAHSIAIDPATGELTGAADRRLQGKASGY